MPRNKIRILIADDELFIREGLKEALEKPHFQIDLTANGVGARDMIRAAPYDLVVLDLRMPGLSGMELLEEIRDESPDTQSILLTAHGNVTTAVEAMKLGAFDFVTKPVEIDHLRLLVDRALENLELLQENRSLQDRLKTQDSFRRIVRRSSAMQEAVKTVKQVAMSDVPVLLRGETGSGKELIARAIHERSRRSDRPFVAVNCGGFTEELFASELFGHVRGAFTGAHADKPGRFTLAESGTLFLDEIGEVALKNQVELLRVLEAGEFQSVGDPKTHMANVRIIAATNRDLSAGIKNDQFRADLYYRLEVVPIDIPALRERREDIPLLAEIFLEESCRAHDQGRKTISSEAMQMLTNHSWPGNVRELRNLIQRLVVTAPSRTIRSEHLPQALVAVESGSSQISFQLGASIEAVEAELIRQTLVRITSNRREAASLLGISVRALQYKLKKYGIR